MRVIGYRSKHCIYLCLTGFITLVLCVCVFNIGVIYLSASEPFHFLICLSRRSFPIASTLSPWFVYTLASESPLSKAFLIIPAKFTLVIALTSYSPIFRHYKLIWLFLCPLYKHLEGKGFLCFVHCCNPVSNDILRFSNICWRNDYMITIGGNWRRIKRILARYWRINSFYSV